jgi:hypothetical protein
MDGIYSGIKLEVRPGCELSAPLLKAIKNGDIILKIIGQ